VLVSRTLQRDLRRAQERPPRRRVHGTAEIPRRVLADLSGPAIVAAPIALHHHTDRVETDGVSHGIDIRFWGFGLLITFAAFAIATLLGRM
jgi:hypothetical protein